MGTTSSINVGHGYSADGVAGATLARCTPVAAYLGVAQDAVRIERVRPCYAAEEHDAQAPHVDLEVVALCAAGQDLWRRDAPLHARCGPTDTLALTGLQSSTLPHAAHFDVDAPFGRGAWEQEHVLQSQVPMDDTSPATTSTENVDDGSTQMVSARIRTQISMYISHTKETATGGPCTMSWRAGYIHLQVSTLAT